MEQKRIFLNDSVYHVFDRGVDKRVIFEENSDYLRFLASLVYYQQAKTDTRYSYCDFNISDRSDDLQTEIIAYCFMPNHFHLILKQINTRGIQNTMSQLLNSYTKYFNTKNQRSGHLFERKFKSVVILSNEQLLHLFRYVLLNPYSAKLVDNLNQYRWSAFNEYFSSNQINVKICHKDLVTSLFKEKADLKYFITNYADYARSLHEINNLVLDD